MAQDAMPLANYEYAADPTVSINPIRVPVSWLNTTTGDMFVCLDNTPGANVWRQTNGVAREAGTFTPYFGGSSSDGTGAVYTTQSGTYTKVHDIMIVSGRIIQTTKATGISGNIYIKGIPSFTVDPIGRHRAHLSQITGIGTRLLADLLGSFVGSNFVAPASNTGTLVNVSELAASASVDFHYVIQLTI